MVTVARMARWHKCAGARGYQPGSGRQKGKTCMTADGAHSRCGVRSFRGGLCRAAKREPMPSGGFQGEYPLHGLVYEAKAPRWCREAFTLVELLIVMTIITILAAMLLPVLSKVRQAAASTACLSNLRQIGILMTEYSKDFGDHIPPSRWWMPTGSRQRSWISFTGIYTMDNLEYLFAQGGHHVPETWAWLGQHGMEVFRCPSISAGQTDLPGVGKQTQPFMYSPYGISPHMDWYWYLSASWTGTAPKKFIHFNGGQILAADGNVSISASIWLPSSLYTTRPERHQDKNSYLFIDGHAVQSGKYHRYCADTGGNPYGPQSDYSNPPWAR